MGNSFRVLSAGACLGFVLAAPARAQDRNLEAGLRVARLAAEPASIVLEAGQSAPFNVTAYDAQGNVVPDVVLRSTGPRNRLRVAGGTVTGLAAGSHQVVVTVVLPPGSAAEAPAVAIPVTVTWPAIAQIRIEADPGRLYAGTTVRHRAAAIQTDGETRPAATFVWSSSDESVAAVDRVGQVTAHREGRVSITASFEGARASVDYDVAPFPAARLELTGGAEEARTGDVLTFTTRALAADGREIADLPVTWSYTFLPDDSINAPRAPGQVAGGKFVASVPGQFTVLATAGPLSARRPVAVQPRNVVQRVEIMGQGQVNHVHTSDFWVFEGRDGRDYAITGTWGADGYAYMWDVTDPSNIVKTDSVRVDARTVNDVKVSPDARYAAMSREGASNRRDGVVILDLENPAHPKIASVYDDGLTGGVHNMFATKDHLFALSAGEKYMILDVTDIYDPKYVSEYDHPDSRIHDVWVHDGIAYSSEWGNGVVIVDVGNGKWGGSIENPKFVANVPYPVGATHAAFPYIQESTGKVYLFLGDEIMNRQGASWGGAGLERIPQRGGTPSVTRGYIHVIDWTDPENPKDVARYEVPEAGTHNIWVEDDKLYVAYYEGGLRVVDVSGELLGDLYSQGREIAAFKAFDPNGYAPNAPMAWGPQPFKGHVFFSDFNSGIWSVKLEPPPARGRPAT